MKTKLKSSCLTVNHKNEYLKSQWVYSTDFFYFVLGGLGAPLPWRVIEELLNTTLNGICNREYGIVVSKYKRSIKAKKFIKDIYFDHNINHLGWSHHDLNLFFFSA